MATIGGYKRFKQLKTIKIKDKDKFKITSHAVSYQ